MQQKKLIIPSLRLSSMQHDQLEFWIDMNLPASLADWISSEYGF